MEAHKLRFVRCPKCLQLLVEYPSISVYQCGGCGTVLRAKNEIVPVTHTDLESGEHSNFPSSLKGSPQNNKSICSDEQKIVSSNAQPSENVVEENISSTSKNANSYENVNQEITMSTGESVTPVEHENEEKNSLIDGSVPNTEFMIKETQDKSTGANPCPKLMEKVENVGTSENANGDKGYTTDDAYDGSVGSEVAAVHSMAGEESQADCNNKMSRETESATEQKCSVSNKIVNCKERAERGKLYEETEAKSNNMLIRREERSQQFEGLRVESHEDLIEELERSLSFSDDEEDFLDVADNNGLNDALHYQIGRRRFSSGGKMNDASRSDPHGRLIEELERSFSDTEEPLEQHVVVADKDIAEKVHGDEHGKDPQSLDAESANPCEGSIASFDDGHLKSGQSFHPNDLTTDDTKEKEEGHMEDDNETNCVHENEHVVVTDKDIAERIHRNEHGKDPQSLDADITNLCEGTTSSFNHGHLKSRQSFQQNELTDDGTKEKEEGHTKDDNMTNCVQADDAAVAGFSSLSNERIHHKSSSFNKKKEERSYRCRVSQLCPGISLDSEDFKSFQNFIESQMDGTSSSLPSGSPSPGDLLQETSNKFKNTNHLERLKKMDELRDQLNRLSSQKGLEKRYQKKDLHYQPQLNSYDVDADSIPSSCTLESYYGQGKQPMYPPPNTFSPIHPCTHCQFGHLQRHTPYNYDAWEFNSYYQSSYAGSTILDHESLKSSYKEQKRVVRKYILRPLSGASPFTICNSCFNWVQMPSDIYLSKTKKGKIQCGQCNKVLILSFPAVCYMDAKISNEVAQKSYKPDDSIVTKTEDAASHATECITGDPVSINEEYGASFTRSFSTQAGCLGAWEFQMTWDPGGLVLLLTSWHRLGDKPKFKEGGMSRTGGLWASSWAVGLRGQGGNQLRLQRCSESVDGASKKSSRHPPAPFFLLLLFFPIFLLLFFPFLLLLFFPKLWLWKHSQSNS